MQVRLLGPVDVTVGAVARSVPGLRRKAVLAVLSLHAGEIVSTGRLIDILWSDRAPATARNTLQAHVSHLRKIIGGRETIVARPPGYVLQIGSEATDAAAAERLIGQAKRSADPDRVASGLRAALALWRGPALADVDGVGWLEAQAERLAHLRREAAHALIEARLTLGEHTDLVPELQRLTSQQPYDEGLHRQLMIALYGAGRQAEALATYQRLRGRLAEDLGIAPAPALRQLEVAILRQDPDLVPQPRAITVSAPTPDRAVPAQLPLAAQAFVSRTAEITRLDAILDKLAEADPTHPAAVVISAVSGTAGIGKTTLAVHWAHRIAARFPDGQLYVNLRGFDPAASVLDPATAIRSFLDAFGIPAQQIPADLDTQASLYRSTLAGKRVLVLLDNARDVEQIRPLLPGSPGCLVLITSRNRLTPLVAAEGAHPLTLDLLSPAGARELLVGRLGADRIAAEPQAVDDIVARCAGLPLALAVAAARAATQHSFSLAAIAAQLRDAAGHLDALRGGDAATDIRAVFSWSYRTLSPNAARLFRLLGLHPGPELTAPAAASLAGIPIRPARLLLAELVDAHLLTERIPGRYTFHDLLRAYATEQAHDLDDEHTRRAALNRILDHYVHAAHAATALLGPSLAPPINPAPLPAGITTEEHADDDAALAWFTAERPVLLAAVEYAAEAGLDTHAWQLAWTLSTFLVRQGFWPDQVAAQTTALAAARRVGDLTGQANALLNLSLGYSRSGQMDSALPCLQQAVDLFETVGDPGGQATALEGLAWLAERQGRLADALSTMQRGLELVGAEEHRYATVRLLNGVGWCHALLGEHERAVTYCERALVVSQGLNDRSTEAATWDSLGYAHRHLGNYRQAVTCYELSVDLYRDLTDSYNEALTLADLGDVHHHAGHCRAAHQAWRTAVEILDRLGHPDADPVRAKLTA